MSDQDEKGFTLIEVLLSIIILTIVLTTFFQFFSQSMLFSSRNVEKQQAIQIVRQLMNELQENEHVYPINDETTLNDLFSKVDNIEELQKKFDISLTLQQEEALIQVHVKVQSRNWNDVSAETYGYISSSP
ncbi:type IV pilus modification PilV family protein [Priestia abyssalis]|uniref:type IV pilus modification PilV family protein n=1 Tax=Priestia abyssalis TaxID=1221450 RepID=UPI001473D90D|nr:type II secretion system protein [Priestia abyssalis]